MLDQDFLLDGHIAETEIPNYGQVPIDLPKGLDQNIVDAIIANRIRLWPKDGRFNIYSPAGIFQRFFQQAVDTSKRLDHYSEINDDELNLDGVDKGLKYFYQRCTAIIHHTLGTSSTFLVGYGIPHDYYAVRHFYLYIIEKILTVYNGDETTLNDFDDLVPRVLKRVLDIQNINLREEEIRNRIGVYLADFRDDFSDLDRNEYTELKSLFPKKQETEAEEEMRLRSEAQKILLMIKSFGDLLKIRKDKTLSQSEKMELVLHSLLLYLIMSSDPILIQTLIKPDITLTEIINVYIKTNYLWMMDTYNHLQEA